MKYPLLLLVALLSTLFFSTHCDLEAVNANDSTIQKETVYVHDTIPDSSACDTTRAAF